MAVLLEDRGKDWPQILAIVVACIPGLTSGIIFSWPSPFILVLMNDKIKYNISEDEAALFPILLPVAMMVSSIFFFKIPDAIGRKYSLVLLSLPAILFWTITIFARDIYSFYVARFISGIGDSLFYAALPIYIGEIATPRIRGTWGNGQSFSFNAGFLVINVLGVLYKDLKFISEKKRQVADWVRRWNGRQIIPLAAESSGMTGNGKYLSIQKTAYICITLPILSAILFLWMPETPYYYLIKGQEEKARRSLKWLLRKQNVESDLAQLKKDVERQVSERGTWTDLFKIISNRKALGACIFLRIAQQSSGIAVFETYVQFIFQKSGNSALSPQDSSIIFSAMLWIVMCIFNLFTDNMGRRKSFIFSALGCAIVLLAESIYFYLAEFRKDFDLSKFNWFPLVGLVVYVIVYGAGLGPLPSLMSSELFSASIKGKALAVTNIGIGLIVTLSSIMFKTTTNYYGLYAPFAIYAICTFIGFLASFYIIPETKGKTLEEIQQDLKGYGKNKF